LGIAHRLSGCRAQRSQHHHERVSGVRLLGVVVARVAIQRLIAEQDTVDGTSSVPVPGAS